MTWTKGYIVITGQAKRSGWDLYSEDFDSGRARLRFRFENHNLWVWLDTRGAVRAATFDRQPLSAIDLGREGILRLLVEHGRPVAAGAQKTEATS